ncbi:MAG TPA: VOC family protein [Gemmatimonadaceae bacterium]|nr:VOC family protein [Gemmatimonadaceae bacterium]
MAAPVVHFEILGKSGTRLQDFYRKLFDWKIDSDNPMKYGLVEKAGRGIAGGVGAPEDGRPGHVTVYVEVPDPDAALERVTKLGGTTIVPTTEIPDMVTFALFADPDGNVVGLVKAAP